MEETRYFGRMSLYALIVGVAYWFLSYEAAGTALLIGFGLATGAGFLWLWLSTRGRPRREGDTMEAELTHGDPSADEDAGLPATAPDGPFGDESGPVPTRSGAPLALGLGVALIGLAGAFGPWFIAAGVIPLLLGAASWLGAADRELGLRVRVDQPELPAEVRGGDR